jgi:hypothetical protein
MRIRERGKRSTSYSLSDHLKLWGGLAVLSMAIALFVREMNSCVATDVKAHGLYSLFPGLAMDDVPPPARERLAATLNDRYCDCGCMMTLASCRNNHASCRTSRRMGQELIRDAQKNSGTRK